jgi:hypothetical protein
MFRALPVTWPPSSLDRGLVGDICTGSIVIAAVNDLHCPFVLWGHSERIANGNLGASLQIRYVLEETAWET